MYGRLPDKARCLSRASVRGGQAGRGVGPSARSFACETGDAGPKADAMLQARASGGRERGGCWCGESWAGGHEKAAPEGGLVEGRG